MPVVAILSGKSIFILARNKNDLPPPPFVFRGRGWGSGCWDGAMRTGAKIERKNMAKIQISIRISHATREKLLRLAECYGTQAEVIAVAIDRLHQAEIESHTKEKSAP